MAARTLIAALPARQGGGRPFGTARKDLETGRSFFLRLCRLLRGIAPLAAGRSPPASQFHGDAASLGPPRAGRRRLRGGAAVCKPSCVAVCRKLRCLKFSFPPGKGGPALGRVRFHTLRTAAAARRRAAALWRRGCRLQHCPAYAGGRPFGTARKDLEMRRDSRFYRFCAAGRHRFARRGRGLSVSQWRGGYLAARALVAALPCLRRGPSLWDGKEEIGAAQGFALLSLLRSGAAPLRSPREGAASFAMARRLFGGAGAGCGFALLTQGAVPLGRQGKIWKRDVPSSFGFAACCAASLRSPREGRRQLRSFTATRHHSARRGRVVAGFAAARRFASRHASQYAENCGV